MKRFVCMALLCFIGVPVCAEKNKVEWSFLIYMNMDPELNHWLVKNINDMAAACPGTGKINILLQTHSDKGYAWRYVIKHNSIKPKGMIEVNPLDQKESLVQAMAWMVKKAPAEHYAVIISDHGAGILSPRLIEKQSMVSEFAFEDDGAVLACQTGSCSINKRLSFDKHNLYHRALLLDMANKTYMSQEQLTEAMAQIHTSVLQGEKLDLLGTDCCKMAMLEVMYPLREHVKFFIGAENCELMDGWNYTDFFNQFQNESVSPKDAAKAIISTYHEYYSLHTQENTFTQSATDLSVVGILAENVDLVAKQCLFFLKENPVIFKDMLLKAHNKSPRMCDSPYYTDLHSVYNALLDELAINAPLIVPSCDVMALKMLLMQGKELIEQAVIANSTGTSFTDAHGISIYFPFHHIDSSYVPSEFAIHNAWLELLRNMVDA
ncbi:MAG: Clostripain family protease [candidate division TM6 bacterium GW2011_GWE2_41_16]|nr:MAG: Clostripain family protease [candidate division TM6 bacterium GW2011_GWE2_41_16]